MSYTADTISRSFTLARNAVMIDLETLDTNPNASILTIGAVKFDPGANELDLPEMEKLYIKVDLDSCDTLDLSVSDDTISWWSKQEQAAQDEAFGSDDRTDINQAFKQLYQFCFGAATVWSNGAAFDVPICENVFKKIGRACPWKFWEVRDVRTMFDLGIDPNMPKALKHCAVDDAWAQAVGVQNVVRKLRELGLDPFKKRR